MIETTSKNQIKLTAVTETTLLIDLLNALMKITLMMQIF